MSERVFKLLVASFKIIILCFIYTKAVNGPKKIISMEGKVVGGNYAKISNFPHAVFLSMTCGDMNMICGSSIINQIILVTAAHCLQCKRSFSIRAHAGDDDLKKVTVVRRATKMKTHPSYSDTTLINDIGLLLLSKNLPLGNTIKRVIIKPRYPQNNVAYVAGWGITNDETRSRTLHLKMVKVPLHSHKECKVVGKIFPGMMCAGTLHSTKDRPSRGDSGSGLITTSHQMLGIVSFRTERHKALIIYTNVSYYYSWIQKGAKQLYCSKRI